MAKANSTLRPRNSQSAESTPAGNPTATETPRTSSATRRLLNMAFPYACPRLNSPEPIAAQSSGIAGAIASVKQAARPIDRQCPGASRRSGEIIAGSDPPTP